ncbi:thermonuclease family protein [Roseicyclus mahoneyensis]|uniref:Nuclease-like protein n=1 Tax=Roseicyclus mahoneyensis TaxID=164332 RepID=A0A316GIR2_9RHOB|nr:thermonuclease family protein [Roseicyclus mahoneyensis]PWK60495.1 nuclease-like protein [Roseicyclus mahoneyensis]
MTFAVFRPIPSFLALVFMGILTFSPLQATASSDSPPCVVVRVVDGDTVDMDCLGEGRFRARLTGYDTPETHRPGCANEALLGQAATRRLRALVADARQIEARLGRWDRCERRLVQLSIDGRDVGARLIAEGLALPYDGGRRPDWCARLR